VMPKIIVNTTFRDFVGDSNDDMQIQFLKSLQRQTMQDFVLVVTIFAEKNVENVVSKMLKHRCHFVYDGGGNYKFSLSKTFMNGVNYGLESAADILLDCSSDIILQKNFLETVAQKCKTGYAGISHPNIFMETDIRKRRMFVPGTIKEGIDVRFYSLDIFKDRHVHELMERYPSYDYGAGIEYMLCGIAIKYAKRRVNIFMESKVVKEVNDRGDGVAVRGKQNSFMRQGYMRNLPVVKRFFMNENIPIKYMELQHVNSMFKVTRNRLQYRVWTIRNSAKV